MTLFCLNVIDQLNACPGVGMERKLLAKQLVGKGIKSRYPDASLIRISRLIFPWSLWNTEGLISSQDTLLFYKASVPSLSPLPPNSLSQGFCWHLTTDHRSACHWESSSAAAEQKPWCKALPEPTDLSCGSDCRYCPAISSLRTSWLLTSMKQLFYLWLEMLLRRGRRNKPVPIMGWIVSWARYLEYLLAP